MIEALTIAGMFLGVHFVTVKLLVIANVCLFLFIKFIDFETS
jgi:hypothetical protein